MKTQIFLAILMILAGSLFSCQKDDDIDMSEIDFSNIEDLYAQPLPVIQKAVQGKWKVYVQFGGVRGVYYPENTYIEITDKEYILDNGIDEIHTWSYYWKKEILSGKNRMGYVLHTNSGNGEVFSKIKNDTLWYGGNTEPAPWVGYGAMIRVK